MRLILQLDDEGYKEAQGLLRELRLPTGGFLRWSYDFWLFVAGYPDAHCPNGIAALTCMDHESRVWAGVSTRSKTDRAGRILGTWRYRSEVTWNTEAEPGDEGLIPEERRTIVTSPDGNDSVYYFRALSKDLQAASHFVWDYGLPYTRRVRECDVRDLSAEICNADPLFLSVEHYEGTVDSSQLVVTGNKLRSEFVRYRHDELSVPFNDANHRQTNRHLDAKVTLFHDDLTPSGKPFWTRKELKRFDGLGHFKETYSSANFGQSSVTTFRNYESKAATGLYEPNEDAFELLDPLDSDTQWILGTYTNHTRWEDGDSQRTEYCFNKNNGFLNGKRVLADGTSRTENDIVVQYTKNNRGDVYRTRYWGGDLQSAGTSGPCTVPSNIPTATIQNSYSKGTRKTSHVYDNAGQPFSFLTLDREIDSNTGLVKASRDTAGLRTAVTYDAIGRLRWIIPSSDHGGARTEMRYIAETSTNNARVDRYSRPQGSWAPLTVERFTFDGQGRLANETRRLPDGTWSKRQHKYDAMGRQYFVSNRGASSAPSLTGTTFSDYDPFGRAGTITSADGSIQSNRFKGIRWSEETTYVAAIESRSGVIESASVRRTVRNPSGRPFRLSEPVNPDGSLLQTEYRYDAGGRLKSVSMPAASGVTQSLRFLYDGRGFLKCEWSPEMDGDLNSADCADADMIYSGYDVFGRSRRVQTGASDLRFSVDNAGRPTAVTDVLTNTALRSFYYAESNGAS